ncbi:ubiquinol-cytochrome C chaperone family protein [Croceicoccus sp. F390]|uniref:Ubiquinol-cytochrome C chaperone family protein n=1 Tax=Croceicoccus esteveae TaxID=3075597 RepID=A0ABU2ZEV8_9SPHN|nr:ubiquinol-cytochrome C chaperone family protein [Croceicoccus sp. F390]MDT0575125.1 ubiquinol-cytochrome C chaperone family protein [Croceicoccus sp. F390]
MFERLFNRRPPADLTSLWHGIVAIAREPHWYERDGAADNLEGRFDMICAVLSLVLLRLEQENAGETAARLTELFIDDMDGQLREAGVGDLVVGKRMGKLMSALGGRLGAYRAGLQDSDGNLAKAARRNITTLDPEDDGTRLASGLREQQMRLAAVPMADLLQGNIATLPDNPK